jgi:hypothetical protein
VAGPPDLLGDDQVGALEDPDVLLDAVDRQLVGPREIADRRGTAPQALEDAPAGGIAEREERAVECRY